MSGLVAWFVKNPVASNLIMALLIIGGVASLPGIEKQYFPTMAINQVVVSMPFPGAGPREVEEQICVRIEEAIHDLDGIAELRSVAMEGMGRVTVEVALDYSAERLTNEIKTRVDAISTFPSDAERPVVTQVNYRHMMGVVHLSGPLDQRELKELGETLRDDLARKPWISEVELRTPRPYEVSINLSEQSLRRYGLNFDRVVGVIRASSLNLPAGAIKGADGDIRVQARSQAYNRADFENITLLTDRDGAEIKLGDVAEIVDGFAEVDTDVWFNGEPALGLYVFVSSKPDTLQTSRVIREWVDDVSPTLPADVELAFWNDSSAPFKARVDTLTKNGIGGLLLVALLLILFLRPQLALWVTAGIAVAFLGAFFLLPSFGVSLNMVSLFAFLLVLGIVVDDAIIVGEAIYTYQTEGVGGEQGAILGAQSVLKPVVFAVLSTIVFFAPMLFLPGDWATAAQAIPVVVMLALFFSLIESLLILPAHLAHMGPEKPTDKGLPKIRAACAAWLMRIAQNRYRPLLEKALQHHFLVAGFFFIAFVFSIALYGGGWLKSSFFPRVSSEFVVAVVEMPQGGAYAESLRIQRHLNERAEVLKAQWNARPEFADTQAIDTVFTRTTGNVIELIVQSGSEAVDTTVLSRELREIIGPLSEAKSVRLDNTIRDMGKPIHLILASRNVNDLEALVPRVRQALSSYPGIFDISDSFDSPRDELELSLTPAAEPLGLTLAEVARQVRQAFYGAEVQRIPRGREDVKVMVRYPESERRSIASLQDMYVRTPAGEEIPFEAVAQYRVEPGYQKLERLNRLRTLEVAADVRPDGPAPREIVDALLADYLPQWQAEYPGLQLQLDGELAEEVEFQQALFGAMALAMLVIYGLMAVAFRSYWQPILVLTAIPFGIMGAIFGHAMLNWEVSMFSMMGVIACAGVVVNDNLVLIDKINTLRERGEDVISALMEGAVTRFRPIILTSLTTFVGLLPIMTETSVQAQFLIPMVISLAFGVLFATGVTLLLVPALYLIALDSGAAVQRRVRRAAPPQ
jgi:multidrug efflux pump subunit AcrB